MTSEAVFLQHTELREIQTDFFLREHVPFCAGDANDQQEIRLACVCRKPFDTAAEQTTSLICWTKPS